MSVRFAAIAAGVIALTVVTAYLVAKPSQDSLLVSAAWSQRGSIPTPQYLFDHPQTLKEAEQECRDGLTSSLYCSNVHKAESLRLADQYRRGTKSRGAAK